eukprot:4233837-Amphidinium_carterae.2
MYRSARCDQKSASRCSHLNCVQRSRRSKLTKWEGTSGDFNQLAGRKVESFRASSPPTTT